MKNVKIETNCKSCADKRFPKTSYFALPSFLGTILLDALVSGFGDCKKSIVEKLEVPTDGSKVPNIHHLSEGNLEIKFYFSMYKSEHNLDSFLNF